MSKARHKPQIVPSQIGISSILKSYRLKVPPHQREYRWTERNVEKLFEDLKLALDSDQPQYFLGTIVTIPDADGVLEIVDGQQRLATITIILSAFHRFLVPIESEMANSLVPFLTEYDRPQRENVPKLKLNLIDKDFFGKMLKSAPPYPELPSTAPLSNKRIRNAFIIADEYVKKIVAADSKNNYGDTISRWIDLIETDAEVILFRVPSGANAYKMFETLNDRGLRTTQADLVKSYLFSKAEDRYPEAQQSWLLMTAALLPLQGDIDDDEDDENRDLTVIFLRSALMCKRGHLTRGEVFEVVQGLGKGPQTVVTFLKELEELARVYEATFNRDHEKWKACPDIMKQAIQTINDFDIKSFRPALLAIAAKFSTSEATTAFIWFVSLGVRLLMTTGTRSGQVEKNFCDVAQKVYNGELKTTAEIKKFLEKYLPTNEQFQQSFQLATEPKPTFARYYLRAMEKVQQKEKSPWWVPNEDKDSMTLEHVLPLNPEGRWPQFTDEEVRTYAKRIGNLCLLPKKLNKSLENFDQKTKYEVYKTAPYVLTSQIADAGVWNVAAICKRQAGLAQLALKAWPL